MSWEDWSGAVREAASQTLGKTDHGQLLHDELVRRLGVGVEVERLDALKKVHYLQLMTPQLLAAFLPSLSDQHASIRLEAVAVSPSTTHSLCAHETCDHSDCLYLLRSVTDWLWEMVQYSSSCSTC